MPFATNNRSTMMRGMLAGTTLLLVLVVGQAVSAHAGVLPIPGEPGATPGSPTKVMVIAEENHTYGQLIGSPRAPYLNQLATAYGSATAMNAGYPVGCPSLAAYILMTSGSTHGICDDKGPKHHPLPGDNIFAQVAAAGLTWRNYAESAPHPCARNSSPDSVFLVRHTPPTYYLSEQSRCLTSDLPLGTGTRGALHDDIAAGTLPAYAFVSPDACHDMHGAPSCAGGMIEGGDAWLAQWVPQILTGPDFRTGRLLIIITWDEGSRRSNHIPTLLLSAYTPPSQHQHGIHPLLHPGHGRAAAPPPRLGCAATATTLTWSAAS